MRIPYGEQQLPDAQIYLFVPPHDPSGLIVPLGVEAAALDWLATAAELEAEAEATLEAEAEAEATLVED
jgi:hypothetical protein